MDSWEAAAESCVRVTLAGFAGSLIGLAKERQQAAANFSPLDASAEAELAHQRQQRQQQTRASSNSSNATNTTTAASKVRRPRRPPPIPIKTTSTNLPMMWSVSCILFTLVLESSRRATPTDVLWRLAESTTATDSSGSGSTETTVPVEDTRTFQITLEQQALRKACVAMGDYAIGGAAAGLAGAVGQQRRHASLAASASAALYPAMTIRSGLVTGLGLGLLAGTIQAAIDVGNLYLEQEQIAHEDRQRREQEEQVAANDHQ